MRALVAVARRLLNAFRDGVFARKGLVLPTGFHTPS